MSDEDDNLDVFDESSDDYDPNGEEESEDSFDETPPQKRSKLCKLNLNTASKPTPSCSNVLNLSDNVMQSIENVIEKYKTVSSENEDILESASLTWSHVTGFNLKKFLFAESNSGISNELYENYYMKSPIDFYGLFVNENILLMMVTETNRYANQCKAKQNAPKARIHNWLDTNIEEMKIFIGILIWMGLVQYTSIELYWSKKSIYQNVIKSVMSRNRFQILVKMWHFNNNEIVTPDRLQKISPLIDMLVQNFQRYNTPNEMICIDETLVPFRGRLSFRQFIKNKRHKFGIKLYKLCVEKGYTYNLKVYCGNDKVNEQSSSESVVMSLAENLLDKGRTIYTDNYYTSIHLAHTLLKRNTHLVGTLRSNRKMNPKEVTEKKLKKDETVALESNTGVVIQKWKDKRDVLTLSTRHTDDLVDTACGRRECKKPIAVIDYNKHKSFIDLSDQMKSYATSLRRGVKWYRKLAVELLIGSALVNAFILHQEVANEKMTITKFKEELVTKFLQLDLQEVSQEPDVRLQHVLEDVGRDGRRRCNICYVKLQNRFGRAHAQKKTPRTKLKCSPCDKFYCLECFFEVHKCIK